MLCMKNGDSPPKSGDSPRFYTLALSLILVIALAPSGNAEDQAVHPIAPIYDQMLFNLVEAHRRDLLIEGDLHERDLFYVVHHPEDTSDLASGVFRGAVILSLRDSGPNQVDVISPERHPERHRKDAASVSEGSPLLRDPLAPQDDGSYEDIVHSAKLISKKGNAGFLVIFTNSKLDRGVVEVLVHDEGLEVLRELEEADLEYVQDVEGRQTLNLDFTVVQEQIYERLVREEGLNPILAWPKALEAIENFRKDRRRTILVVGKA
jgi:hypothetical protein